MTVDYTFSPLKVGQRVKILNSGLKYGGRIVAFLGPLGPGGARIYRVRAFGTQGPLYGEFREDQLELMPTSDGPDDGAPAP